MDLTADCLVRQWALLLVADVGEGGWLEGPCDFARTGILEVRDSPVAQW
jgi:hypothetical protein